MKRMILAAVMLALAGGAALAQTPAAPPPLRLTFTNLPFEDGGVIPDQYTAKAATQPAGSFPLSWTNVPAATQSFVLLMHDIDSNNFRSMNDNTHWLAFNIPATATSLPAGMPALAQLPDGTIQPRRGTAPNLVQGYAGPGAPPGNYHHYSIELYALDTKLALTETAAREDVVKASEGHVIAKAIMVGRFHR